MISDWKKPAYMLQNGESSRDVRRNNDGQSIKILLKVAFLPVIRAIAYNNII